MKERRVAVAIAARCWWRCRRPRRTRSIQVKPDNRFEGVELTLRLEAALPAAGPSRAVLSGGRGPVGNPVVLCFRVSANGYVAVWKPTTPKGACRRASPPTFTAPPARRARGRDRGGRGGVHPPAGESTAGEQLGVPPLHAAGGAPLQPRDHVRGRFVGAGAAAHRGRHRRRRHRRLLRTACSPGSGRQEGSLSQRSSGGREPAGHNHPNSDPDHSEVGREHRPRSRYRGKLEPLGPSSRRTRS